MMVIRMGDHAVAERGQPVLAHADFPMTLSVHQFGGRVGHKVFGGAGIHRARAFG